MASPNSQNPQLYQGLISQANQRLQGYCTAIQAQRAKQQILQQLLHDYSSSSSHASTQRKQSWHESGRSDISSVSLTNQFGKIQEYMENLSSHSSSCPAEDKKQWRQPKKAITEQKGVNNLVFEEVMDGGRHDKPKIGGDEKQENEWIKQWGKTKRYLKVEGRRSRERNQKISEQKYRCGMDLQRKRIRQQLIQQTQQNKEQKFGKWPVLGQVKRVKNKTLQEPICEPHQPCLHEYTKQSKNIQRMMNKITRGKKACSKLSSMLHQAKLQLLMR